MQADLADNWRLIQAELRGAVEEQTFDKWLAPLEPRELSGRTLVVAAPEPIRRWVAGRFERVLQTCSAVVLGADIQVDVVGLGAAPPPRASVPADPSGPPPLNPDYTFERFVIGSGNRLAHAAALAVAELPGQAFNPLFIYGRPGLGKTHLLHAVAAYLRLYSPSVSVRCTTIEQFTTHFVGALHSGAVDQFKRAYRGADVLLIDDVQFLQSKAKTEEEFFHTFNALYDTGSQLVLTCDCPPSDMDALEERLRERFESGLLADIDPPDFTTRLTIVRKRAQDCRVELADNEVLDLIAERVTDNIRALEGALTRVTAYASLTGSPVTLDLARGVLDRLHPQRHPAQRYSVRDIQLATCRAFAVSLEDLLSANRAARIAWPRQVAMHLARTLTDMTLPAIGQNFGGRDHTTVMHADRRARKRLLTDAQAQMMLERVHKELSQPPT